MADENGRNGSQELFRSGGASFERVIRVERHPRGPRVYIAGVRVHECSVGLVSLGAIAAFSIVGVLHESVALAGAASIAAWLVLKDWRDLFPSKRDSACWAVGLHRRLVSLRPTRRSEGLPAAAGLAVLGMAVVNLASALTPTVQWRAHLLLQVEPVTTVPVFHALALPAGAALAVAAFYLFRRRRRAVNGAIVVLAAFGVINMLKGLDFEETALSWSVAALLWWGRDAFHVCHEPLEMRSALWRVPLLASGMAALATVAVWAGAAGPPNPVVVGRETAALLLWSHGPMTLGDDYGWLPLGVGLISLSTLLAGAYLLFRPLAVPRTLHDRDARRAALELIRAHGRDTLSFFKLRTDAKYLFACEDAAFLAYRIENGVLLVSGDPVGPAAALPGLLCELCAFAELRGLKIGVVGAGRELLPLYRQAGLRAFYIGDEAIVDTGDFSLEGRAIRKVRQSVNRLKTAGYSATACRLDELDPRSREALDEISSLWRGGAPERGFSMAMDSLHGEHQADSVVVVARDADCTIRGFLHFVPTYGRHAVSLSFMRRDPGTPNGLMEFLIVRAIDLLRERGIEELSLNFAAFARLLHSPEGRRDRFLGRVVALANPFFQIESLYRFNAKFSPRWVPRYLLYEGALGLPRVGLATMRIEGHVPSRQRKLPAGRTAV